MLPAKIKTLFFLGLISALFPLVFFTFFLFDYWWNEVQTITRDDVVNLTEIYSEIIKDDIGSSPYQISLLQKNSESTSSGMLQNEKTSQVNFAKLNYTFLRLFFLIPKSDLIILSDKDNELLYSNSSSLKSIKEVLPLNKIFDSLTDSKILLFEQKIEGLSPNFLIGAGTHLKKENIKIVFFRQTNEIFGPIQKTQGYFWVVLGLTVTFSVVLISYLIKKLLYFVK